MQSGTSGKNALQKRGRYERLTWQSIVEGALEAMCSSKGASNLFEIFFLDGERVWFWFGTVSGKDRVEVALKQVKKYLRSEERYDKVFLFLKADNLLDAEVQAVKKEIERGFKNSELKIAVSKTNGSDGFLTISLFCRTK